MEVLTHHLYEYKKGLRNLVLHSARPHDRQAIETKLRRHDIAYQIYAVSDRKMNVFFGAPECVEVIRRIGKPALQHYTPEEDFILGIMLGYDRLRQSERYLARKARYEERTHDTARIEVIGCTEERLAATGEA